MIGLEGAQSCLQFQFTVQACATFLVLWCCHTTLQITKKQGGTLLDYPCGSVQLSLSAFLLPAKSSGCVEDMRISTYEPAGLTAKGTHNL